MMPEVTADEVMNVVTQLRDEVEKKGFIDKDKIEKLNVVLDQAEEKAQKITTLEQQAITLGEQIVEVKEAREELQKAGELAIAEMKGRVDQLEAELARSVATSRPSNYADLDEYKALNEWCRQGVNMDAEQKAYLRTDSAVQGGILTPTELDTELTKKIVEIDPIRSVSRVRSISSKAMEMAIRNTIPTATYEGEAEEGPDDTSTYESVTVTPFRQTFTTPITMDMLMDAGFDMNSEIASDAAEAFAFGEAGANGFVLGSGHKMPAGFMANATILAAARVGTGTIGEINEDDIMLLTGDLKVGYNPVYCMNRRTLAIIRTLKSSAGGYLWQPGMSGPVANTLNGFPYILANSMADVAGGAYALAFGDFRRGYTIVDRTGMSVIRDEYTLKKKAIVEFTMNRWNTGLVVLTEAIKVLQIKAS
jgi:HK97 family phage major capsid protein